MGARLNGFTQVDDVWYGPDDDVPADVAAKIGPHAWVDGEHPDAASFVEYIAGLNGEVADQQPAKTPPSGDKGDEGGQGDGGQGGEPLPVPPKAGAGSGESDWRAYAESVGFDADELAKLEKRDEIIDALTAAGLPVERSSH